MLRTMYSNDKNMYISRFYIRFSEALDSVASVKLLNEAKSPLKFYKITFDRKKVVKWMWDGQHDGSFNFCRGMTEA